MNLPCQRFEVEKTTYIDAVAKTSMSMIFLLLGICNPQRHGIGKTRSMKSVITLKSPVASKAARSSKHLPGIIGFQIFFLGLHITISKIVSMK